jgi:conserved hypothetical protein
VAKFNLFGKRDTKSDLAFDNKQAVDFNRPGVRKTVSRQRNIYDYSRQEGNNPIQGMNRIWIPFATTMVGLFLWLILQVINVQLGKSVHDFNKLAGKDVPDLPPVEWWKFIFGMYHQFSTWCIFIVGVLLTYFFIERLYKVQHSVDDSAKQMLEYDTDGAYIENPELYCEKFDYMFDVKVHRKGYNKDGDVVPISVANILSHMMIKQTMGVSGKDGRVKFDEKFAEALFDVAKVDKSLRKLYDPKKLPYNPDKTHGKSYGKTLADSINSSAYVPDCEDPNSQDPAGIFICSTAPENTVVVTETRGGKGQKYIEPILDVWSRQADKPNIVTTDLKMELLRMCLRTFTLRGYNVKSLNLLVPSKTDTVNFLGYAVDSAIRGDIDGMEETIANIADIYFPKDNSDNPMWQNAASAVFKRTAMGLIDYVYEEVQEMKHDRSISPGKLRQRSDELWGQVTLYNAYKFIVTTAAEIYTDPEIINLKPGEQVDSKSGMTLYFDATDMLYPNSIRQKIANNDKPIRTVADSERMLASIYGIALFGMIFFTDDRIIKLTSARPSENLDMTGFAYPRRLSVKFDYNWVYQESVTGDTVHWSCYEDPEMTKPFLTENGKVDKDFIYNVGTIDTYGWADFIFKGIFPQERAYIKLEIHSADNGLKSHEFRFMFKKDYRKSYTGQQILLNPITHEPEVQGGHMSEYILESVPLLDRKTKKPVIDENGDVVLVKKPKVIVSHETSVQKSLLLNDPEDKTIMVERRTINDYDIRYAEKPTILFLVAPPNLASYNKILLITIDMLYNKQVSAAYSKISNQKPFYETKYLLDEFGNMKSDGQGVPNLDTKLSSGLGQGQQFTLILQALKQLENLYGADVAETLKGNVGKFLFMKSKDPDTIDTLMGMNGEKYVVQKTSQTNEKPVDLMFNNLKTKSHISETRSRDVVPVISKNEYLRLNDEASDGNAIVSTGTNPIVSFAQTILPMSYRLHVNRTGGTGSDISVQNPPTIASTLEFDALRNMPRFRDMIAKRVQQAKISQDVLERYKKVNNYDDDDIARLNQDVLAGEIMYGINMNLKIKKKMVERDKAREGVRVGKPFDPTKSQEDFNTDMAYERSTPSIEERRNKMVQTNNELQTMHRKGMNWVRNNREKAIELAAKRRKALEEQEKLSKIPTMDMFNKNVTKNEDFEDVYDEKAVEAKREGKWANNMVSELDLINMLGQVTFNLNSIFNRAYQDCWQDFQNDPNFMVKPGEFGPHDLFSKSNELLIRDLGNGEYEPLAAFYKYLYNLPTWSNLARGAFEREVIRFLEIDEGKRPDDSVDSEE